MKTNFKYPIIGVFFDADQIPCVFVDEVKELYPNIEYLSINYLPNSITRPFTSFSWSIGNENVMAIMDLQKFINFYKKICNAEHIAMLYSNDEVDLSMLCECSVCDKLLLWNDEAYCDEVTGQVLCDNHSITNEETGNYIKAI